MITVESLSDDLYVFHEFCKANKLKPTLFWLAGSAARLFVGKSTEPTGDLDILVTRPRWDVLTVHNFEGICSYAKTGFGDWKVNLRGLIYGEVRLQIDFMFGNVGRYLSRVPTAWDGVAVHLATKTVLTTAEFHSSTNYEITSRHTRQPNYRPYYVEHLKKQGIVIQD